MEIRITPRRLHGTVTPPPSKSLVQRRLLCAALANGIVPPLPASASEDVRAAARCMAALLDTSPPPPRLDCGESAATLRFLLPLSLVLRGGGVLTGRGRLLARPLTPYFDIFEAQGVAYRLTEDGLTVSGSLTPGVFRLPGNVSSQFVSGLLLALPLLDGDSSLVLTTPLESRGYAEMTAETMAAFGVHTDCRTDGWRIPGRQRYHGCYVEPEADWSQAAFWVAARFLGGDVTVNGLSADSNQGDRAILELEHLFRANGTVEVDLSHCPDLLPPLAVMAAVRRGMTRFTHAERLRFKESDRLDGTAALLVALGVRAEADADSLTVRGGSLTGGTVDGRGDHRLVMAAAIAACACREPVVILGAEAVNKSYPDFFAHYAALGGERCVL